MTRDESLVVWIEHQAVVTTTDSRLAAIAES